MKIRCLILLFIFMTVSPANAQSMIYKTWAPWEIDSFMAAWALKRYVHPEAKFVSLPKGTKTDPATTIDTPDAKYRRNATKTAFEEVVRIHKISMPCFDKIRPIVRLLELSRWRKSENREAEEFEDNLRSLLPKDTRKGNLEKAFEYVDKFCKTSYTE